jgi:hypothetical protein
VTPCSESDGIVYAKIEPTGVAGGVYDTPFTFTVAGRNTSEPPCVVSNVRVSWFTFTAEAKLNVIVGFASARQPTYPTPSTAPYKPDGTTPSVR